MGPVTVPAGTIALIEMESQREMVNDFEAGYATAMKAVYEMFEHIAKKQEEGE